MDFIDIIEAKKMGQALTKEQIVYFAEAAAHNSVPSYQLAALLMAIRLKGMNIEETTFLTLAMAESGDMLSPDVDGIPVDKHSTGGVGDTTTLVLAPLVAACHGKVLKMSGRGLGHTGGTVDKLESIKGFQVFLEEDKFVQIVRTVGCAVVGQSAQLAPADKTLYALRDVTGTVDSIPLIASSILSKKFASGARAIVLDVKFGSGALMETLEDSIKLAQTMVDIGTHAGREIIAIVSSMEEPLGTHIGNALEVKEAIDVLSNRCEGDLKTVSLFLGAQMLMLSKLANSEKEAHQMLQDAITSKKGLLKLEEMIEAQGGDKNVCTDTSLLPQAPYIQDVLSDTEGYLSLIDTTKLGETAQKMGAGRRTKEDIIDPAVGIVIKKRLGDSIQKGDVLFTLYAKNKESFELAQKNALSSLTIQKDKLSVPPLIYAVISKNGIQKNI